MCTICDRISKAKNRDHDSMMELFSIFKPLLKKYAYKLGYEDAEADLNLNMIQLIYDMPTFRNDGQAVSYIKQSIHNYFIKHVKQQIQLREKECSYDPDIIKNMEKLAENFSEPYIDLYAAIEKLPEKQRLVIIYKFIYMMSDSEVMDKLHISRQSVYVNKKKAIKRLRKLLNNEIWVLFDAFSWNNMPLAKKQCIVAIGLGVIRYWFAY